MAKISVPRFKKEHGFETTPQRSLLMSKIKGVNTKPEILIRKALWLNNIRYKINYLKLPGKPDIVIKKYKVIIFVDGEFWHGYNWEKKKPKIQANKNFWVPKIERNMQRDVENNKLLTDMGYTVLRFWEHEIKKDLNGCVITVLEALKTD